MIEVAHHEPPHQDLRCLQIQLFSSLVVKELTCNQLLLYDTLKPSRRKCAKGSGHVHTSKSQRHVCTSKGAK